MLTCERWCGSLFGRRLVGGGAALVAAGLVTLAPAQIAASQEARMYGLLTLTALLSWWALWGGVTGARVRPMRTWAAYTVAVAAMLYTHYFGFFVVGAQFVWLLWRRTAPDVWRRWFYAGAGALLLFLPWATSFIQQLATGRGWPAHRLALTPALLIDTLAAMVVGRPILDPGGLRAPVIQVSGSAIIWPNAAGTLAFYRQPRPDVFDWRLVSRRLAARAQVTYAVVFLPGFSRIPVSYCYRSERRSQLRLALTPDGDDVVGPGGARLEAVSALVSDRPRVWILTVPPAVEALIGALE